MLIRLLQPFPGFFPLTLSRAHIAETDHGIQAVGIVLQDLEIALSGLPIAQVPLLHIGPADNELGIWGQVFYFSFFSAEQYA